MANLRLHSCRLEVLDEEPSSESGVRKRLSKDNEEKNLSKEIREGRAEGRKMSLEAFRELLVEHKVELSKFGTGTELVAHFFTFAYHFVNYAFG